MARRAGSPFGENPLRQKGPNIRRTKFSIDESWSERMAWLLFLDESGHDHKQMPYEVRRGMAYPIQAADARNE